MTGIPTHPDAIEASWLTERLRAAGVLENGVVTAISWVPIGTGQVGDSARITLTYETPARLLAELRELGRNLNIQRFAGLRGRRWRQQLVDALMGLAKPEEGGRLSLSFEIVYGHALRPQPRAAVAAQTEIGLDQMRQMLRRSSDLSDKV